MTDEMVWALRKKLAKGVTVPEMSRDYGIPQRVIAAATGGKCYSYHRYWTPEDLWRVRELLREGYSTDEVAALFGASCITIANVICRNRDLFRALDRRG